MNRARDPSVSTRGSATMSSRMLCEHLAHLRRRRLVPEAHGRVKPELVAARQVLDLPAHDGAVRDADDRALVGPQARRPQRHVLDLAELSSDAAGVAHRHRLVGEHREAGEDVLEALLGRERDDEAADAESRQRRRDVDPEDGQREDQDDQEGHPPQRPAAERERGPAGRASGRHDAAQQEPVDHVHDPQQQPQERDEQQDVEQPVVVDPVEDRDPEPEDRDAVQQQGQEQRAGAARARLPFARDALVAGQAHEREDSAEQHPGHAVEDRQQEEERDDLPEGERTHVGADEKRRQLRLHGRDSELSVEPPRLADRLPGEEPDGRRSRGFLADEEDVDAPVDAEDLPHLLDVGRQAVVERSPGRAADALEARRDEAVVEHRLELADDVFALRAQGRRDLEVLRGGRVAALLDGMEEAEEGPVRRLAAVGVGRGFFGRRRRRRRQREAGRPPARRRARGRRPRRAVRTERRLGGGSRSWSAMGTA